MPDTTAKWCAVRCRSTERHTQTAGEVTNPAKTFLAMQENPSERKLSVPIEVTSVGRSDYFETKKTYFAIRNRNDGSFLKNAYFKFNKRKSPTWSRNIDMAMQFTSEEHCVEFALEHFDDVTVDV